VGEGVYVIMLMCDGIYLCMYVLRVHECVCVSVDVCELICVYDVYACVGMYI